RRVGGSCARTGIREITTRRRHGTDDGDGALAVGGTQADDLTGTLVERGQTSAEVGRITGIGGHLSETARNLTQGLGPARRRVSHHSHVEACATTATNG